MNNKRLHYLFSLLMVLSMILAACAPQQQATEVATEAPAAATEEPAATAAPTEEPAAPVTERHGGWLDEIVVSVVDGDSAVSQIQAGAIDFYSFGLASDKYPVIKDAGISTTQSLGAYYGMSFNPAVFTDTTVLNPFSNRKIREAMNWLIDRNYINQEIYGASMLTILNAPRK
jgi:ABC-type oligopeptide transport system substrate-binding subunit